MANKLTLADVLVLERAALYYRAGGGFVYCSKPFPCGVDEAMEYFKDYEGPVFPAGVMADKDTSQDGRATIERLPRDTVISIKPLKGSRLRKPYKITLWI